MVEVRVTAPIISEVFNRELQNREDEGAGMSVYTKIYAAESTRKDGSVTIKVNKEELTELYQEADYWADSFDCYMMPRGEWMAWKALKKQTRKLIDSMEGVGA